jgi:ABC-type branched-subunit amino acid transport system ATPase component
MSVRDNVLIGGHCRSRGGFVANALRLPIVGREERLLSERATGLLRDARTDGDRGRAASMRAWRSLW